MEQPTASLKQCISEITKKQIVMSGDKFIYLDNKEIVSDTIIQEATTLKQNKDKMLQKEDADNTYESEVAKLTEGVPSSEIQTWTKQEQEARAYLKDSTSSTPLIDALVLSRGVDKDYLVTKIIEKADAYASAIGALTGERQKVEVQLGL